MRVSVAEKRDLKKITSLLSSGMDILIGRRRVWSPIPIKMGVRAVQGPVPSFYPDSLNPDPDMDPGFL